LYCSICTKFTNCSKSQEFTYRMSEEDISYRCFWSIFGAVCWIRTILFHTLKFHIRNTVGALSEFLGSRSEPLIRIQIRPKDSDPYLRPRKSDWIWPSRRKKAFSSLFVVNTSLGAHRKYIGTLQASKQQRKFLAAPDCCSYSAICDASRHVYIYRYLLQPPGFSVPVSLRDGFCSCACFGQKKCYVRASVTDPDPPGSEIILSQRSGSEIINFRSGFCPFSLKTMVSIFKMYKKVSKFIMITSVADPKLLISDSDTDPALNFYNFFSPSLVYRRIRIRNS